MHTHHMAANILAQSFLQYPLMRYAFNGRTETQRMQLLQHLYGSCVTAAARYGGVITQHHNTAALIWLPGVHFPLGLAREIKSGMATLPFKLGLRPTLRLLRHDAVPEGWIKANAGNNFGYIWCVGVSAGQRGKGLSRLIIEQSIQQMKANGMQSFWLKTEDPVNVDIYGRLGFKVAHQGTVPSSGLKSWCMYRT